MQTWYQLSVEDFVKHVQADSKNVPIDLYITDVYMFQPEMGSALVGGCAVPKSDV